MTEGLEEFQTKWWNEGLSKQLPQTQGSLTDEMCKNWQGPRIDEWSPGRTRAKYENNDEQTWIEVVWYRDCAPKYVSEFLLNFSGSCARKPICPTAWQRRISSSETTSRTVPATKRPVALADPRRRWEVRPGGIFLPRNNTRNHAYCFTNKNLPAFTESEPKTPCQTQTMLIGFRFCFFGLGRSGAHGIISRWQRASKCHGSAICLATACNKVHGWKQHWVECRWNLKTRFYHLVWSAEFSRYIGISWVWFNYSAICFDGLREHILILTTLSTFVGGW